MQNHPFPYDLHPTSYTGPGTGAILCLHGYGGDYRIAQQLQRTGLFAEYIGFNFPDFGIRPGNHVPERTSFGTIRELLPALYMLKQCVIDAPRDQLTLYGFSAGGGALVNLFMVLQTTTYDTELRSIGITPSHKEQLLLALGHSSIILDTPLRSISEIIAHRGTNHELEVTQQRYTKNSFVPIDSLTFFADLTLNVIVHFQLPDEVLSNRDDALFAHTLTHFHTRGKNWIVTGNDGGHGAFHASLWNFYAKHILKRA